MNGKHTAQWRIMTTNKKRVRCKDRPMHFKRSKRRTRQALVQPTSTCPRCWSIIIKTLLRALPGRGSLARVCLPKLQFIKHSRCELADNEMVRPESVSSLRAIFYKQENLEPWSVLRYTGEFLHPQQLPKRAPPWSHRWVAATHLALHP